MTMTTGKAASDSPEAAGSTGPASILPTDSGAGSVAQRAASGKAARKLAPRKATGDWVPGPNRREPIEILQEQAETRVPELVPIRYGRMMASPFAFYRGAAAVMAADLAAAPTSGLRVQACGDAHLSNFGVFAAPDRNLVFDINDFDETAPGPWEWDVKRLVASLELAARDNGFSPRDRTAVVADAARAYRESMAAFAQLRNLEVWYLRLDMSLALDVFAAVQRGEANTLPPIFRMIVPGFGSDRKARAARGTAAKSLGDRRTVRAGIARATRAIDKATTRSSLQALSKLTKMVGGELRFVSNPPMVVPIEEIFPRVTAQQFQATLDAAIDDYRSTLDPALRHLVGSYRLAHVARKVVGVGSVGTRAWVALMLGKDNDDPLLLQIKEAQPSVLERYVGASEYPSSGQRVVVGQRLMQTTGDIFLGWQQIVGVDGKQRDFYVRQLRDGKGSADVAAMTPTVMRFYAGLCGWTLARAHARTGDRIAIAGYLGSGDAFDRAMGRFATAYADTTEADHAALVHAVHSGRIEAQPGV